MSSKRVGSGSPNKEKAKRPRYKYLCRFNKEWLKKYDFIQPASNENCAYCVYCKTDINIGAGGSNDIVRHAKTVKHVQHSKGLKNTASLDNYIAVGSNQIDKVRIYSHFYFLCLYFC
jgi:hypothetical protein